MKKIQPVVAAVILAAAVTACGGSTGASETADAATSSATNDSSTAVSGSAITIENMAFGQPLTVAPGATVTIANMDTVEHSVTSRSAGMFDVHVDGQQKGTLVAPTQPGEYPFYCVYHPSMKGTLIVK
jgi:plastocyanin